MQNLFDGVIKLFTGVSLVFTIVFFVLVFTGLWAIFKKAGLAGWKCLIPLYGSYCLYKIAFGAGPLTILFFLLSFTPGIGYAVVIVCWYMLMKSFGHGIGYMFGVVFLPFVFLPIIGLGNSIYSGPESVKMY